MTPDDPNDRDDPETPVNPFPTGASPFPPLVEAVPAPAPVPATPIAAPGAARVDPPSDWIENADAHDLPIRDNALLALGRFAFPPAPPPDEEGVAARDRRWTSRAIVVAVAVLLIFNAVSVQTWARQQPPGWVTSTVQQLADVWAAQVALLGADQPREGVRTLYQDARDRRFVGAAAEATPGP
jgi:hypothetical protein